jgi:hypothetical protein
MVGVTGPYEKIYVTFPNREVYEVPARLVAESRARHFAEGDEAREGADYRATYEAELAYTLGSTYELRDWLLGNMDWADVKEAAVLVSEPGVPPGVPPGVSIDYERSWSSVHTEFAARTGAA